MMLRTRMVLDIDTLDYVTEVVPVRGWHAVEDVGSSYKRDRHGNVIGRVRVPVTEPRLERLTVRECKRRELLAWCQMGRP